MKKESEKSSLRQRANEVKPFRCRDVIAVLENPKDFQNVGTVIRNVNALGITKVFIVDEAGNVPDDWQVMRTRRSLIKHSSSAIKWSYTQRFPDTESCYAHLKAKGFRSAVTSPHRKGKRNLNLEQDDFSEGKLAVWFGNEIRGISDQAVALSDFCINIPMYGIVESYNLGTASGIVLYEVTKQRRNAKRTRE